MAGLALVGKWKDLAMIDWIVVQVRPLMDSVRGKRSTHKQKHTGRSTRAGKKGGVGCRGKVLAFYMSADDLNCLITNICHLQYAVISN